MTYIVFLGPPGVGKGTAGKEIESALGIGHFSSGDWFRYAEKNDSSELGKRMKEAMVLCKTGVLVPDDLTFQYIQFILRNVAAEKYRSGALFDGFPRTQPQAEAFDDFLTKQGTSITNVFYLTAPSDVLERRITNRRICPRCDHSYSLIEPTMKPKTDGVCDRDGAKLEQRNDDTQAVFHSRLAVYDKLTHPLVAYYKKQGKLIEIDGSKNPGEVHDAIKAELQKIVRAA